MAASTNYINTNPGNTVGATVTQVFDQHPWIHQYLDKDVAACMLQNTWNSCDNPAAESQIDLDIINADAILEFLAVTPNYPQRELWAFQMKTSINFLKAKKCIHAQYPCWANDLYLTEKIYIDTFDYSAT